MPVKKNQILFISHKANRGGACVLLLETIREFRQQTDVPIKIILLEEGPLVEEFRKLAPTFLWYPKKIRIPVPGINNYLSGFVSRVLSVFNVLWILFSIRRTTLVFSNTITNGHIHKKLRYLKAKFITYVHELTISIHALTNDQTLKTVLENTDLFLTGSRAVQENLIANHSISRSKTEVVYSSIPVLKRIRAEYKDTVSDIRQKFGIPENSLVFGVAGENEWRKGFDLFAPLIKIYLEVYPMSTAHFVWMGIRKERANYFDDMVDFEKFSLDDRCHFLMHGSEYLSNMALFDVHMLLSREDPFPLVVLDAASFAIPTLCFRDAGGAPEFIGDDAGMIVPYGNLLKFSEALYSLETDERKRLELGAAARKKLESGYSQSDATARIIKLINQTW